MELPKKINIDFNPQKIERRTLSKIKTEMAWEHLASLCKSKEDINALERIRKTDVKNWKRYNFISILLQKSKRDGKKKEKIIDDVLNVLKLIRLTLINKNYKKTEVENLLIKISSFMKQQKEEEEERIQKENENLEKEMNIQLNDKDINDKDRGSYKRR